EAPGAERMEVADTRSMQDEEIDAALADAPLECLGPNREGRQVAHRAETTMAPETLSTTLIHARYPLRAAVDEFAHAQRGGVLLLLDRHHGRIGVQVAGAHLPQRERRQWCRRARDRVSHLIGRQCP